MNELTKKDEEIYKVKNLEMRKEWNELYPKIDEFCERHKHMIAGFTIHNISKFSIIPSEFGVGHYTTQIKSNNSKVV